MVAAVAAQTRLPVVVIVRPRGGDFTYSRSEIDVMRRDIEVAHRLAVHGVAIGVLRRDGRLDEEVLRVLISDARGLAVTVHRAFDVTPDLGVSLELLAALGVARVLTSGGADGAAGGKAVRVGWTRRRQSRDHGWWRHSRHAGNRAAAGERRSRGVRGNKVEEREPRGDRCGARHCRSATPGGDGRVIDPRHRHGALTDSADDLSPQLIPVEWRGVELRPIGRNRISGSPSCTTRPISPVALVHPLHFIAGGEDLQVAGPRYEARASSPRVNSCAVRYWASRTPLHQWVAERELSQPIEGAVANPAIRETGQDIGARIDAHIANAGA